jgi:predicted tellurium resistance membrane protein TerC
MHDLFAIEFTLHNLINFVGGAVLIYMAGHHIRNEWRPVNAGAVQAPSSFSLLMFKLAGTNFIFSLDSVLSAVGMVDHKGVAAAAIIVSAIVMVTMVARLSDLLARYPDFKTLGLCFVFCIGAFLVAESFGHNVPKGIVYSCLGFGLFIQIVDSFRPSARAAAAAVGQRTMAQAGASDVGSRQ